jgi:hypothetical protein
MPRRYQREEPRESQNVAHCGGAVGATQPGKSRKFRRRSRFDGSGHTARLCTAGQKMIKCLPINVLDWRMLIKHAIEGRHSPAALQWLKREHEQKHENYGLVAHNCLWEETVKEATSATSELDSSTLELYVRVAPSLASNSRVVFGLNASTNTLWLGVSHLFRTIEVSRTRESTLKRATHFLRMLTTSRMSHRKIFQATAHLLLRAFDKARRDPRMSLYDCVRWSAECSAKFANRKENKICGANR